MFQVLFELRIEYARDYSFIRFFLLSLLFTKNLSESLITQKCLALSDLRNKRQNINQVRYIFKVTMTIKRLLHLILRDLDPIHKYHL